MKMLKQNSSVHWGEVFEVFDSVAHCYRASHLEAKAFIVLHMGKIMWSRKLYCASQACVTPVNLNAWSDWFMCDDIMEMTYPVLNGDYSTLLRHSRQCLEYCRISMRRRRHSRTVRTLCFPMVGGVQCVSSHLMETLAFPEKIEVPMEENGKKAWHGRRGTWTEEEFKYQRKGKPKWWWRPLVW